MKQQGEIAALNRAQEKAEARVSSIHHQLTASESELSVLEGEMAEVGQLFLCFRRVYWTKCLTVKNCRTYEVCRCTHMLSGSTPLHVKVVRSPHHCILIPQHTPLVKAKGFRKRTSTCKANGGEKPRCTFISKTTPLVYAELLINGCPVARQDGI